MGGARHANSIWTCLGSSDGSTAGIDAVNRWVAHTNCVFQTAGTAHSWILLQNVTLGLQCVLDCNPLAATSCGIAFAKIATPFTGGSTLNRPLSTGEFCCGTTTTGVNATFAFISDQITGNFNWTHYITTDDGRFLFLTSRTGLGVFSSFMGVLKTTGEPAGDTQNFFAFGHTLSIARGSPTYANIITAAGCSHRNINGTTNTIGGVQSAGTFGGTLYPNGFGIDAATGNYNAFPCHVTSLGTQPAYRGLLLDIQVVGTATVGGAIPTAAAQLRIVAGDLIIPWPTVNPIV